MLMGWHGDGDFAECTTKKHSTKFLKYGSTSDRLVNTYIMIVHHSSCFKVLLVTPLALLSCPRKMLRLDSSLPVL